MGTGTEDTMYIPIGKDGKQKFPIDANYHLNIEGMSGVGKSTLLKNIFIANIRAGHGGCFIDPHGDAADDLLELIPKSRRRDLIWIDPDAERVPGINILAYRNPDDKERGVEAFITIMKALAGTAWGDETGRVITNAADSIVENFPRPTAVPIFRFMADDEFREKVLKTSTNPFLQMFKEQYDDKLRESDQMAKFSPPINKLGKLMRPFILPIIGQDESLDFLEIMNARRIVICRFSKGRLGEEISQVLGSLLVSMISIAGLQREKQLFRPPFMLMIDEVANFVHGGRFTSLLEESRKYGIALVLASQGLYQLPFRKAIFTNCSTKIVFNVSGEDAQATADDWRWNEYPEEVTAERITALPRYHFYCRTFQQNVPVVKKLSCLQPVKPRFMTVKHAKTYHRKIEADAESLKRESLERWGNDKKAVLARIMRILRN